jgi:hypothetical protein
MGLATSGYGVSCDVCPGYAHGDSFPRTHQYFKRLIAISDLATSASLAVREKDFQNHRCENLT